MLITSASPMLRARLARAFRGLACIPGWRRSVNRLVPEHEASFTVYNGSTAFSGTLASYIDRQVYLFGGYETGEIDCFLSQVAAGRNGTVLDIGANVGTHSLAFARAFQAVHAFEPNPLLWQQYERNVQLNGLKNIQLHKLGLSDIDAELTLHLIDKANFGLGTFSTVQQYEMPLKPLTTAPVRNGAAYLAEIGVTRVDAVKLDVQGFEAQVLRGLASVLVRDRPLIWCEIGAATLTGVSTLQDLRELVPFDVRCYKLVPKRGLLRGDVEMSERDDVLDGGDYLLVPT